MSGTPVLLFFTASKATQQPSREKIINYVPGVAAPTEKTATKLIPIMIQHGVPSRQPLREYHKHYVKPALLIAIDSPDNPTT
jgi:hypothetical protein